MTDVLDRETACSAEGSLMVRVIYRFEGRMSTNCEAELKVLMLKLVVVLVLAGFVKLL